MFVPVQLDKVRNFRYGMRAIDAVEKRFKKNVSQIDFNNLTMQETATLIWAGLQHEDKGLTPERVMDLVDEKGNFTEVLGAMQQAFEGAFGNGEAKEKN